MNAELSSNYSPTPVISAEGRYFRVSVLRSGRVESYLCETEAEARRWADVLSQPPTENARGPRRPAAPERKQDSAGDRMLRLVRTGVVSWKPRP